jgi:hypothetical protein
MPPKSCGGVPQSKGKAKKGVRQAKTGSKANKPKTAEEKAKEKKQEDKMKRDKQTEREGEDKTFGIKNKNKSKRIQKEIAGGGQGLYGDIQKKEEKRKQDALDRKKKAKETEAEMSKLFGTIDEKKRGKTVVMFNGKKMTRNEIAAAKEAAAAEKADAEAKKAAFDRLTIFEKVEVWRQELDSDACTRCTAETFAAWRSKKDAETLAKKAETAAAAMRKKSTRHNARLEVSGLSGKDLFEIDAGIFKDDEAAVVKDEVFEYDETQDEGKEDEMDMGAGGGMQVAEFSDDDEEEAAAAGGGGGGGAGAAAAPVDATIFAAAAGDMDGLDDLDDMDFSDDEEPAAAAPIDAALYADPSADLEGLDDLDEMAFSDDE